MFFSPAQQPGTVGSASLGCPAIIKYIKKCYSELCALAEVPLWAQIVEFQRREEKINLTNMVLKVQFSGNNRIPIALQTVSPQ